jgi:hypothetical protein
MLDVLPFSPDAQPFRPVSYVGAIEWMMRDWCHGGFRWKNGIGAMNEAVAKRKSADR